MFNLSTSETIWKKVKVPVPVDFDRTEDRIFQAQFKRLSASEMRILNRRRSLPRIGESMINEFVEDGRLTEEEAKSALELGIVTDEEIIEKYLLDWKDVIDKENNPVPFNASSVALMMDIEPVQYHTVQAFFEAQGEAKEKNLKARRASGRK